MPLLVKILHRSKKRTLVAIPFFFTFGNALCGFLSIISSIEGDCTAASYYIILAVLMDLLDGRIARALNSVSALGTELDSLCDAVSFCIAPSILIYRWHSAHDDIFLLGALLIYICAGLFRLAKFNSTIYQQRNHFIGLPTPISALWIVHCILYHEWLQSAGLWFLVGPHGIKTILFICSLLMVSTIKFATYKQVRMPLIYKLALFCICILMFSGMYCEYPSTFFALMLYIAISVGKHGSLFMQRCL